VSTCRRVVAWSLLAVTVAGLTPGCQYLEMVRSRRGTRAAFARDPRLALQRTLTPEDSFRVVGRVTGAEGQDDQLLAVAVGHHFAANEVVAWKLVPRDVNLYSILLPKADYDVLVFADIDRDGVFESSELVGSTDPAALVHVDADASRDGFQIDGPPIAVDPAHPQTASVPVRVEVSRSHNVLPSLNDDFFALRWGQRGLFHPMELLVHTQGYFFGLEEPDPDKTQVIFVHGAGGAPVEFTSLVEGLDRKRYQPWFFFYPSGLPLEQSAAVLSSVLELAVQDLGLRRVAIVAHSMGGLVAYAAVATLCRDGLPDWLALFVSIATPYGGHDAARLGVERASEVVPSWRDLVPGGAFLRHLDATPLPDALPFYVVFAYDNRARFRAAPSGDGTITLRSQLALPVHLRARNSYGVDATHTGVLTDATTREIVLRLLDEHAAPHGR
jgi:pimeloyl-ACP methyl ester carboxylesterase